MRRSVLTTTAALLAAASPAAAQPVEIAPGVTLDRVERPGPQVVHVMRVRQGPLTRVAPILTSGSPARRERLSVAISALAPTGAVGGINGDFFNVDNAYPSGLALTGGELVSEPEVTRSATLFGPDGRIQVPRLELTGRFQAVDPAGLVTYSVRTFNGINRPAERSSEVILYTPRYGAATPTPSTNSRFEAAIQLDAGQSPTVNAPLSGTVVAAASGGGMPIGPGQVVVTGVGSSGPGVAQDLVPGRRATLGINVPAIPAGVLDGIGGGPLLVSAGVPVTDAGEGFTAAQLTTRTPRSAVGQTAGGDILLVTTEGPATGSRGVTAAEQAQLMAELGAVDAMGLDAGGSATLVASSGLVFPSGSERAITTALAVFHRGVSIAPLPLEKVSPNGDRVEDTVPVEVRTPVPGTVTVSLERRGGGLRRDVLSGPTGQGAFPLRINPRALGVPDGPYAVVARLAPADGSAASEHRRRLIVDGTLGGLRLRAAKRGRARELGIRFTLARKANVTVRVLGPDGRPLRTLRAGKALRAGPQLVTWDRTIRRKPAVGAFTVDVQARSSLGTTGLQAQTTLTY
ncbi:MAG: phosphodiester glycosidase family protein [Actinomycetota bacterium]